LDCREEIIQVKEIRMGIRVELFGIPRSRAGAAEATAEGATLGEVLLDLGKQFPEFAATCLNGNALAVGYAANLNGEQFVCEPDTPISDGDCLLIFSSDAGG
jgi:molybdopterin converting factor small subunit